MLSGSASLGPFRTLTPLPPAWRDGRSGLKRSPSAQKHLLELGGESPKPSRTSLRRTIAASSQSSYASLRAESVPSAPSVLDCFPPFHVWAFVPPAAEKCACCFSSNRGVLTNFTDTESTATTMRHPKSGRRGQYTMISATSYGSWACCMPHPPEVEWRFIAALKFHRGYSPMVGAQPRGTEWCRVDVKD